MPPSMAVLANWRLESPPDHRADGRVGKLAGWSRWVRWMMRPAQERELCSWLRLATARGFFSTGDEEASAIGGEAEEAHAEEAGRQKTSQ